MYKKIEVKAHGDVLINLICERNIKVFAEVGVYKGKTIKRILTSPAGDVLDRYFAIDHWEHKESWTLTEDKWDWTYNAVCKHLPWFKQLQIIKMESVKAANLFWNGFFDMVYIDANHEYQPVIDDIKAWLPRIKKGGILAGHDYLDLKRRKGKESCYVKSAVDDFFGEENIIEEFDTVWIKEL